MPRLPVLLMLFGLVIGCSIDGQGPPVGAGVPHGSSGAAAAPQIRVDVLAAESEHVWDIGFLPGGSALIIERPARIKLLSSTRPGASLPTSTTCTSPGNAA
ncbi:MAG: hypothetical protein JO287_17320 [Pseudonocardiales bacterium]|nr:hypothetical protein [Pseudonocardiales bacterium]